MLWVLEEPSKRDGSFEHPKHMLKLMGKNIFTFYAHFFLSKPVVVVSVFNGLCNPHKATHNKARMVHCKYIEGSYVNISITLLIFSLKIDFALANSDVASCRI